MATRKNRREKGSRADARGSNPHSYGESFSWSMFRVGSRWPTMESTNESAVAINK